MANGNNTRYRHFILSDTSETQAYRSRQQGGGRLEVPEQNRVEHFGNLRRQIDEVRNKANSARQAQQDAGMEEGLGLQVEFESFPDIEFAFERLAKESLGIELLNVQHDEHRTRATVFVPDGELKHFEDLVSDYLGRKTDSIGRPRDRRALIDAIQQIRAASLRALWTDAAEVFPTVDEGPLWWEAWLPTRGNQEATAEAFRERAETLGMQVAQGNLIFPERTVLLVRASLEQMQSSMTILNDIAELRRAKETAEFFDDMPIDEQRAWLDNLLKRIQFPSENEDVPYVCLLDTGVNRGHPLLTPVFAVDDLHTVEPGWGVDDADGHGTEMAGLALTGDLTELLVGSDAVEFDHRLESVKLLPHDGANEEDPRHHGYLTKEAVASPRNYGTIKTPRFQHGYHCP